VKDLVQVLQVKLTIVVGLWESLDQNCGEGTSVMGVGEVWGIDDIHPA
jgi:hypothetical protein